MGFPFDELRMILRSDLTDALTRDRKRITSMVDAEEERSSGAGGIDGVSLDILPWHRYVGLSFRLWDDEEDQPRYRYSPADWQHYEFIGDGFFDASRRLTGDLYEAATSDSEKRGIAHLIQLAAAEALLDPAVAAALRACGIEAPDMSEREPDRSFEYLVLDDDRVVAANYCEVVLADRYTQRLLRDDR